MVFAVNLDDEALRSRFLVPYEHGQALTGGGRSIPASNIDQVLVIETVEPVEETGSTGWNHAEAKGTNRTDDFIIGPPGGATVALEPDLLGPGVERNPKRVGRSSWFSARADAIEMAYLDSSSVGFA